MLMFASIFIFASICALPLFCFGFALTSKRFLSYAQFRVDPVNLFSRDFASIARILLFVLIFASVFGSVSLIQFRVDPVNLFSRDLTSIARVLLFVLIFASIVRFASLCVLPLFCYCFALILKRFFSDA